MVLSPLGVRKIVALAVAFAGAGVWLASGGPPAGASPVVPAAPVLRALLPPEPGEARGDLVAVLTDRYEVLLEARPTRGEGLLAFARRLCGTTGAAEELAAANGGQRELLAGMRYRIPFSRLTPGYQVRTIRALFPDDAPTAGGWRHRVYGGGALARGSLWHVAQWFTGSGESFAAIRERNGLSDDDLPAGRDIVIPTALLRPAFRALAAAAPAPIPVPAERTERAERSGAGTARLPSSPAGTGPTPPPVHAAASPTAVVPTPPLPEGRYRLEHGRDSHGEYAIYRLAPGEALYSSVVVRFTGALFAADVNALAAEIATRSGITDVTDIPIGYEVKVPFDLLLPEYLPAGHPRRREYEENLRESGRFTNQIRTADLSGITVVLDAGHGGVDSGASFGGVWESLYVYDIQLRVKHLLETHTSASVVTTTRDGDRFEIPDRDVLPYSRGHAVMTDPPYPIANSTVGVNLRWYLANSVLLRTAREAQSDPRKVVFVSIHADSLHPSLRGAMAYIPAAAMRQGTFRKSGPAYEVRREWKERPAVSFSWQERIESEGLSRQLADELIGALARRGVAIHPYKPVREKIVRNRSEYVPAVLRYNAVPAKILFEVCNLTNEEDRRLLQTREFRQRIAEALVESVLRYYGQGESFDAGLRVAAAAGR